MGSDVSSEVIGDPELECAMDVPVLEGRRSSRPHLSHTVAPYDPFHGTTNPLFSSVQRIRSSKVSNCVVLSRWKSSRVALSNR